MSKEEIEQKLSDLFKESLFIVREMNEDGSYESTYEVFADGRVEGFKRPCFVHNTGSALLHTAIALGRQLGRLEAND